MIYNVTGTLSPDATCDYHEYIGFGGKQSYRRLDGNFFIWWDDPGKKWIIAAVHGCPPSDYWQRADPSLVGIYTPQGEATGDATVTIGSHL